jgi:hypothetical protein
VSEQKILHKSLCKVGPTVEHLLSVARLLQPTKTLKIHHTYIVCLDLFATSWGFKAVDQLSQKTKQLWAQVGAKLVIGNQLFVTQ